MEQLLPVIAGVIGLLIVWKALKGVVKLVGFVLVIVMVAALYFGLL